MDRIHGGRFPGGGDPVITPPFFRKNVSGRNRLLPFLLGSLLVLLAARGARGESGTITVSATILSKSICKFDSAAATLAFGNLDPGNPLDVSAATTVGFRCIGSAPIATFSITDDDGQYDTGPDLNRMRHAVSTTDFLPYTFALSPESGTVPKNVPQVVTIQGTVRGADYQNALAGNYSDRVVVTLLP